MVDKAERIESALGHLAEIEDIPDEILNEFVDNTQDFFESYVTTRIELKTLQELEQAEALSAEDGKVRRRRRLGEHLPEDIAPKIRAANEEYFQGNFLRATALARDAISEDPHAAEPYSILSLIAEENDSPDVALSFLVKAAERSTDSAELWAECARLAQQLGKLSATVGYLKKAARSNREDTTILLELYELLNTKIHDSRSLTWTLNELSKRDPTKGHYARELATIQYQSGQTLEALETMRRSVDAQFDAGMPIDLCSANMLADGYLREAMNDEVLALDARVPDAPPDFRANAAIALIRKRDFGRASDLLRPLSEMDPTVFVEIFTTVTDELVRAALYSEAAHWYGLMFASGLEQREDLAQCLALAGHVDHAIEVLQGLITDCPSLTTPPIALFQMMRGAGRETEAVEWLEAHCQSGAQHDEMIIKRATLSYDAGNVDEFLQLATPLLSRVLYDVWKLKMLTRESKVVEGILGLTAPERMNTFMMRVLRYRRFSDNLFPVDEPRVFSLAATCLSELFDRKRLNEALVIGGLLVMCRERLSKRDCFEVLFQFALVAFAGGDGSAACGVMRSVLLENNDNELVWEFFNVFLQKTPEKEGNTHKFLLRTLSKLPDCVPLQIMLGNHSQSTVWFDHAITQYLNVLRDRPDEPIVSLLLAASFISKAYVRTQRNPRKSVLCSYASIRRYCENRVGDFPTEVNYNLGKFYQTLRMYPQAEKYYRKVLDTPVDYACIAIDEQLHDERYSLKRDAAFNLSLILRESNPIEARRIMRKFLTV